MTRHRSPDKAMCPECYRRLPVVWHHRLIFIHHRMSRRSTDVCPGSGYLVEDEDMTRHTLKTFNDQLMETP